MTISVFLAADNLIVREGVKALLDLEDDFEVVGQAADHDGLVAGAEATNPQVIVTDIRMPPDFSREGIDAAKEVRKRYPGTGVVILSQFDDPDYAVSLLSEGCIARDISQFAFAARAALITMDRWLELKSRSAGGPPGEGQVTANSGRVTSMGEGLWVE
jgi:DNA-binding NarL/FixJ family response regulator